MSWSCYSNCTFLGCTNYQKSETCNLCSYHQIAANLTIMKAWIVTNFSTIMANATLFSKIAVLPADSQKLGLSESEFATYLASLL